MFGGIFKLWSFLVWILFPIPTFLLVLLTIPLPNFCRGAVLSFTTSISDFILFRPVFGFLNIWTICTLLSLLLTLLCANELQEERYRIHFEDAALYRQQFMGQFFGTSVPTTIGEKAMKWRYERNFWISLFSFVLWIILFRIHLMLKHIKNLETYDPTKTATTSTSTSTSPSAPPQQAVPVESNWEFFPMAKRKQN